MLGSSSSTGSTSARPTRSSSRSIRRASPPTRSRRRAAAKRPSDSASPAATRPPAWKVLKSHELPRERPRACSRSSVSRASSRPPPRSARCTSRRSPASWPARSRPSTACSRRACTSRSPRTTPCARADSAGRPPRCSSRPARDAALRGRCPTLVAGSVDGLDPTKVSVVVTGRRPRPPHRASSPGPLPRGAREPRPAPRHPGHGASASLIALACSSRSWPCGSAHVRRAVALALEATGTAAASSAPCGSDSICGLRLRGRVKRLMCAAPQRLRLRSVTSARCSAFHDYRSRYV